MGPWMIWLISGIFTMGVVREDLFAYIYKYSRYEDSALFGSVVSIFLIVAAGPLTWACLIGSWFPKKFKALMAKKNLKELDAISKNVRFLIEHKAELKEIEDSLGRMTGEELEATLEDLLRQ